MEQPFAPVAAVTNRILESEEYLIIIGQIQYYSL
jgi:hypothetical protein